MFNQQKSSFGNTSFGGTSGGLFGNKTNTGSNLFGNTGTSAFGSASTSGFGSFGANTSTGSIFGTPASKPSTGIFGTPVQQGFGSSASGNFGTFSQNRSGGLFGSTPAPTTSSFGSGLFGNTGTFGQQQQQSGTGSVKFSPTTGSDTMMKGGIQTNITTKHQCITAMKEYETKSFEELRTDDYLAGRKGQSTASAGAAASNTSGFGFGQKSTAPSGGIFATSNVKPSFGTSSGGLFGNTNTSSSGNSIFGGSKSFGASTTSSGFSFGSSASTGNSLFGNTTNKPTGSVFGNTAISSSGLFGNPASTGFGAGNSVFGKSGGFGTTTTGSTGFGNTSSNMFGNSNPKPTTGLFGSGFGQQSTGTGSMFGNKSGFGQTNTSTGSLFGNVLNTNNQQNKSLFSGFGTGTAPTLGGSSAFNFNTTGNTLGGGFGSGTSSGSLFGQQASTGGTAAIGALTLPSASNQQSAEMLQALLVAPFGDSPLFKNTLSDPVRREEVLRPTNPIAQKAAIQSPLYIVSPAPKAKIKPKARSNNSLAPSGGKPHQLFAGLELEEEASVTNRSFVGRSSVKRLTIKVTPNSGSYPGTPHGSSSSSSAAGSVGSGNMGKEHNGSSVIPQNESEEQSTSIVDTPLPRKQTSSIDVIPKQPFTNFNDTINDLNVRPSKSETARPSHMSPTATKHQIDALEDEVTDEIVENGKATMKHPAGITLSRSGYYTLPNLVELGKMVDENNRCKVTNFTIGHRGYGAVFFQGEVDLTDMDLDSIVHIRRKEVTIYPDDDTKPPLGVGLNRRAEITLDCVWPTDKTTREPVMSPERLTKMGWEEKLEKMTAKMGARFREYRADTGSWVFQVNHFSKYRLPDSEDEEEAHEQVDKDKQIIQLKKTGLWSAKDGDKTAIKDVKLQEGLGGEEDKMDAEAPVNDSLIQEPEHQNGDGGIIQDIIPSSHKFALSMGIQAHKLQSMKSSFFADDEDDVMSHDHQPITGQNFIQSHSFSDRSSFQTEPMRPIVMSQSQMLSHVSKTTVGDRFEDKPQVQKTKRLKSIQSSPMTPTNKMLLGRTSLGGASPALLPPGGKVVKTKKLKIPMKLTAKRQPCLSENQLRSDCESVMCDAAQSMSRSFRVGWGPGWTFVHCGHKISEQSVTDVNGRFNLFSPRKSISHSRGFTVNIERLKAAPVTSARCGDLDTTASDIPYLAAALIHSDRHAAGGVESADTNEVHGSILYPGSENTEIIPFFTPSKNNSVLSEYAEISRRAWLNIQSSHPDSGFTHLCHQVFGLCNALWGRMTLQDCREVIEDDITSYEHKNERKKLLVEWLTSAIEADVKVGQRESMKCDNTTEQIFQLVSEGKLRNAVELSLETGNNHLAFLLSLSSGSMMRATAVAKQLVEWEETGADNFIPEATLKMYSLLAGKPVWLSGGGVINTCAGLDWKRSLLLHINFISESVSPIVDGIQLYRSSWKGDSEYGEYSSAPLPSYIEREQSVIRKENCKVRDICYHILLLYCKRSHRFETTLCPSSSVPHPLDHRVAWHVWRILYSAGYRRHTKRGSATHLHQSYAAQLEEHGLWEQAVFVLMHITNNKEREFAIRDLISRHVTSDSANQEAEMFITRKLGVPESWLHDCRALHARYSNNNAALASHLLSASHWKLGHDVVMRHLAADALIHERLSYLSHVFGVIEPSSRHVVDWQVAGKVYHDYTKLQSRIHALRQDDVNMAEIQIVAEELGPEVTSLCKRVAQLKCNNPKDALARAEMAKQSINLHNTLQQLQQDATNDNKRISQATNMNLPEDYALQDLYKLVRSYFTEGLHKNE